MENLNYPEWTSIGMVGVLALLLVREVFSFLRDQRNGKFEAGKAVGNLEGEIIRLNASIGALTEALTQVIIECRATQQEVREVRKDIDELKGRL